MSIVVDSSAMLAVVLGEDDADIFHGKLIEAEQIWMNPINLWEVYVKARVMLGDVGEKMVQNVVETMRVEIVLVGAGDAKAAFEASKRFAGRPARLNLGDCFAYALARAKDAPLLFKGNDFAATDVKVA